MKPSEPRSAKLSPFRLKYWLIVIGLMLLPVIWAALYFSRFESYSVCYECGRRQESVAWEIPFVHRALYESTEVFPTRLSEVIQQRHLAPKHRHDWQFVFGAGNGSPMVFGPSRSIGAVLASNNLGNFIEMVAEQEGDDAARRWIATARDGRRTAVCNAIARAMHGRTFSNAEEFKQWLAETEKASERYRR